MKAGERATMWRHTSVKVAAVAFWLAAMSAWGQHDTIRFSPAKSTDSTRVATKGNTVVLEVRSPSGVGSGRLLRVASAWPEVLTVRLKGFREIEHFRASSSSVSLICALERLEGVASQRVCRLEGEVVGAPRQVGADFVITIPAGLFGSNPQEIVLEWVDYWR
jgi:hypothetical protein